MRELYTWCYAQTGKIVPWASGPILPVQCGDDLGTYESRFLGTEVPRNDNYEALVARLKSCPPAYRAALG